MQADAEERRPLHTSEKAVSLSDRELEFVLLIAEQAAKLHVRPMSEHQDWQRRLLAAASTAASEFPISGPSDWVVACEALVSFFGLNPVSAFGCASDKKEARDRGVTVNANGVGVAVKWCAGMIYRRSARIGPNCQTSPTQFTVKKKGPSRCSIRQPAKSRRSLRNSA
jgi:hypothetical protein